MDIEIEYVLTRKEYLEAFDRYDRTTKQHVVDLAMGLVLLAVGALMIATQASFGNLIAACLFMLIGALALVPRICPSRLAWAWSFSRSGKAHGTQKIRFTDTLIHYRIENASSDIQWNYYRRFLESASCFLLVYGPRTRHHGDYVPTSSLPAPATAANPAC
jgi:hypothetical protein